MRIGIISDTHGHLEPDVFKYFEKCDEIWHAGDIGDLELLKKLENFKPTVAVFGNIDDHRIRTAIPEDQIFERSGIRVLMTHIAGKSPRYNRRVKNLILETQPHVLVCGHSHVLKVEPDKSNNLLFINPGAAGIQGFHKMKTLLRLEIQEGKMKNLEVIELGLRGKI